MPPANFLVAPHPQICQGYTRPALLLYDLGPLHPTLPFHHWMVYITLHWDQKWRTYSCNYPQENMLPTSAVWFYIEKSCIVSHKSVSNLVCTQQCLSIFAMSYHLLDFMTIYSCLICYKCISSSKFQIYFNANRKVKMLTWYI